MLAMIERFLRMEKCVRVSLIECGSKVNFTDEEIETLTFLKEALQPIKDAVDRLSRRNANLLTAERIINVVFETLKEAANPTYDPEEPKKPNPLADILLDYIKIELEKRRPTDLVHLMEYLQDSSYIKAAKPDPFGNIPCKKDIVDLASKLLNRLYPDEDNSEVNYIAHCYWLSRLRVEFRLSQCW